MTALKSQIANIDASGNYTHDISGTDQVKIGGKFSPDRLPSAYLWVTSTTPSQIPGKTLLSNYDRTMVVQIEMWVGANSEDSEEIHLQTLDAQNDLKIAIESDRTLGGQVNDVELGATLYSGEQFDSPSLGVLVIQLSIMYTEEAGG